MQRAFAGEQTRGYGTILGLTSGISTYEILNERIIQCVPRPGTVWNQLSYSTYDILFFMYYLAKRRRLCHTQTPKSLYIWNLEQSLIFRENKAIVHSHDLQANDIAVRDMRKV